MMTSSSTQQHWELNRGPHICQASTLSQSHINSPFILLLGQNVTKFPRLALNVQFSCPGPPSGSDNKLMPPSLAFWYLHSFFSQSCCSKIITAMRKPPGTFCSHTAWEYHTHHRKSTVHLLSMCQVQRPSKLGQPSISQKDVDCRTEGSSCSLTHRGLCRPEGGRRRTRSWTSRLHTTPSAGVKLWPKEGVNWVWETLTPATASNTGCWDHLPCLPVSTLKSISSLYVPREIWNSAQLDYKSAERLHQQDEGQWLDTTRIWNSQHVRKGWGPIDTSANGNRIAWHAAKDQLPGHLKLIMGKGANHPWQELLNGQSNHHSHMAVCWGFSNTAETGYTGPRMDCVHKLQGLLLCLPRKGRLILMCPNF